MFTLIISLIMLKNEEKKLIKDVKMWMITLTVNSINPILKIKFYDIK